MFHGNRKSNTPRLPIRRKNWNTIFRLSLRIIINGITIYSRRDAEILGRHVPGITYSEHKRNRINAAASDLIHAHTQIACVCVCVSMWATPEVNLSGRKWNKRGAVCATALGIREERERARERKDAGRGKRLLANRISYKTWLPQGASMSRAENHDTTGAALQSYNTYYPPDSFLDFYLAGFLSLSLLNALSPGFSRIIREQIDLFVSCFFFASSCRARRCREEFLL